MTLNARSPHNHQDTRASPPHHYNITQRPSHQALDFGSPSPRAADRRGSASSSGDASGSGSPSQDSNSKVTTRGGEEYELKRAYESGPTLPFHLSNTAMSSQDRTRFAVQGGFDPYASVERLPAGYSQAGEDKVREKGAGSGIGAYARAGLDPVSAPTSYAPSTKARYASLIPEKRPPKSPLEHVSSLAQSETAMLLLYTFLALLTRLWGIGKGPQVIWDEAHFGKFGSHYLKREFYFDVHPPLGKMLVGLAGLLSGYNGHFEFKSGEAYPANVNYVGMRVFLALFGVAMVPFAWATSGGLGWNWRARHALTIMVLLDNGWLVISRFILLDSMLLCFTFSTVHGLIMFHGHQHRPFSQKWWFWLAYTGVSIGCVMSVKWVGLFAMALVGLYTIEDLWDKFGDLKMPVRAYARHWCARLLCLIVVPLLVYMASFKMHFLILNHSGPGDAQMSSLFQAHLKGNDFATSPLEVAYGSKVTFKNMGYGGGLLHSHVQTYPVGSQQQQVTCYHYKDNNNDFIVTPTWDEPRLPVGGGSDDPPRMFKNGDTFRFVHEATGRNLHSHAIAAPITKENYEISGYGNATVGDWNDHWIVEVVDDLATGKKVQGGEVVRSLTTRMRFRHKNLGCYMRAGSAVLPQWGWKQIEVSCDKENNPKDEHTYWNVESHHNDKLPAGSARLYKSRFLDDWLHLNAAMWQSNNALIPDADKFDILSSSPFDWLYQYNGLRMNSWAPESRKYYLLGNPIIWWGSTTSLAVFALVFTYYLGRMQRRHADLSAADWNQFLFVGKIAGLGWVLHFMPSAIMSRVLYLHHYLPTLYFATIMLAHLLDHFLWNPSTARYKGKGGVRAPLSEARKNTAFAGFVGLIFVVFLIFKDTAYGREGKAENWPLVKWRKSWNIHD
ncbi:glycosyltransferase family 39 protein [Ceraceosorus bombacis]|uniref:Dolichyl-phosphate-mannose--protein mannosyltransferase n=1 Tax=Ceraceosorus bombacis TaxID=401625 RepID=A0A0P1BGE3_9BASI|nr:glycosyltransferase family 39 protein [Ceraceosorus bombacis]